MTDPKLIERDYMREAAYVRILECIATGLEKGYTREVVSSYFPALTEEEISREMKVALPDALWQGIEREDIDRSWFT